MSETISFGEIATDWRVPGIRTEVRARYSSLGLSDYPSRIVIIAQKLSAGTGAVGVPIQVFRLAQVTALAGAGSQAEDMARHALAACNGFTPIFLVLLADPSGGTAAAGSLVFSGTPAAGNSSIRIAGKRIGYPVLAADTVSTLATRVRAAINARADLPVAATGSTGTVTLTAKHAGVIGNGILCEQNTAIEDATPTGLTATLTQLTSGAGNVDITATIAALATEWFTDWVVGFNDGTNLGLLATELDRRFTATGRLDAKAVVGLHGSISTRTTAGAVPNNKFISYVGGAASAPNPWWCWAAAAIGRAAFYLGEDPARQLRTLTLPGIIPPPVAGREIESEQDTLLRYGFSTVDYVDGAVAIQRLITTKRTTDAVEDTAWLDVMTPATLSRIRYDWHRYTRLLWPRHKLAPDGSPAAEHADNVVTPRMAHAAWAARCVLYERVGWITDASRTIALSTFQLPPDGSRNRMQARLVVRIMDNLMNLDEVLEFEA
jgi:phage tail sheath gpL-like